MTYFVTPSLCVGAPPPYPHEVCSSVDEAVQVIRDGGVAVVAYWGYVVKILRQLGVDDQRINDRILFAYTGQVRWHNRL